MAVPDRQLTGPYDVTRLLALNMCECHISRRSYPVKAHKSGTEDRGFPDPDTLEQQTSPVRGISREVATDKVNRT
jgi:hypothetical protein